MKDCFRNMVVYLQSRISVVYFDREERDIYIPGINKKNENNEQRSRTVSVASPCKTLEIQEK